MSDQILQQESRRERQRRREVIKRKAKRKPGVKVWTRYDRVKYGYLRSEEIGTFAQLYTKYKGKYQFWCADHMPHKGDDGTIQGYRLDDDRVKDKLRDYGHHKAWLVPGLKIDGKKVVAVWNADS